MTTLGDAISGQDSSKCKEELDGSGDRFFERTAVCETLDRCAQFPSSGAHPGS
jgi:hypothetical protein